MKNPTIFLIGVLGAFLGGVTATAQTTTPATRIMVVDMARLFDGHYKTIEQNQTFASEEADATAQLSALQAEINQLADRYRALDEANKNPLLNDDIRSQNQAEMQRLLTDANTKNTQGVNYRDQVQQQLNQRIQAFRSLLLEEISTIAADVGRRMGASLILDKSAMTTSGMAVLYSDPSYDITDAVMAEIERTAPPPPAPEATAAPATTPAAPAPAPTAPAQTAPAPAAP
jgi:outer membrane protein